MALEAMYWAQLCISSKGVTTMLGTTCRQQMGLAPASTAGRGLLQKPVSNAWSNLLALLAIPLKKGKLPASMTFKLVAWLLQVF